MAYQVVIGGEETCDLASIGGWRDVKAWADELSVDKCEELIRFVDHGLSQDLPALESQIESAMEDDHPEDMTVASTMRNLLACLQERDDNAESAFVSDGMGSGDDEEDWGGGDFDVGKSLKSGNPNHDDHGRFSSGGSGAVGHAQTLRGTWDNADAELRSAVGGNASIVEKLKKHQDAVKTASSELSGDEKKLADKHGRDVAFLASAVESHVAATSEVTDQEKTLDHLDSEVDDIHSVLREDGRDLIDALKEHGSDDTKTVLSEVESHLSTISRESDKAGVSKRAAQSADAAADILAKHVDSNHEHAKEIQATVSNLRELSGMRERIVQQRKTIMEATRTADKLESKIEPLNDKAADSHDALMEKLDPESHGNKTVELSDFSNRK